MSSPPPSSAAMTAADRRRDEFPSLRHGVHLLSHSLGPIPAAAFDSLRRYAEVWAGHPGTDAWQVEWWGLAGRVGDAVARVIGAPAGSVLPTANATAAMATIASCFDLSGARSRIVTSELDFPSMAYLWGAWERLGAEVVRVPSDDGISLDPERVAEALDERTALLALAHIAYASSHRFDPAPLIERAHRVGARVCLDVYQSAGITGVDARGWGVDFLVGGSVKWLCGGPACGWLYVRPELQRVLEPRLTGWLAHDDPLAFAPPPIRYAEGIGRFRSGTPGIPALYSFLPGLEIIADVGVERIASESRMRTQRMIDALRARGRGVHTPSDADRRGGTVIVDCADPAGLTERLAARRIHVDWRPRAGIRVSPHFFTTDEEVDEALEAILDLTS